MKSLIIFYSVCLLMFYSLIVYIGHRNKNSAKPESTGLLEDVTAPSSDYKISKSKLLSQNFDNAIVYMKMEDTKNASEEIYKAIMTLAIGHISAREKYVQVTLNELLKDLSICYIQLKKKEPVSININKIFESSELFIAYGYMAKARKEIRRNLTLNALDDIRKTEECLALSAKYARNDELKTHVRLAENTKELLHEVAQ